MQDIEFVQKNSQGLDEVRVADVKGIEAPLFTPEIGGPEGLQALLNAKGALGNQTPIAVAGYRWRDIRSKPRFKNSRTEIKDLVANHPIYYYEPVELFRYTLPQTLVTYGLQGDQSRSRSFYSSLRKGEVGRAISMLPKFFQPFVEAEIKSLCSDKGIDIPAGYQSQGSGKIHEAWRDKRADTGFTGYFEYLANDAANSPNSAIIVPVPPVMKTTGQDVISRTIGFNSYMKDLCMAKWNEASAGAVTAYLHFYVDQGVFDPKNNQNDQRVINAIGSEVTAGDYAGVALTISNYENIWKKGNESRLEQFITEVSSIARENHLPVILPRSGYFGMHLTDHGVQNYSRLMNGNSVYNRRSGGIDERSRYGTVPIYGSAIDVNVEQLETILNRNGGSLHPVPGVDDSPRSFNSPGSSYEAIYGKANRFRIEFGKPRRMVHLLEAKELRQAIEAGTADPARRYLERSDHPQLAY